MAKVTAAEVAKLRKQTGSGMMDCKNALVEAEGDFEKAIEILRKKGQKIAAKRSDRDSNEGVALATTNADHTFGVLLSLNCETDFVANNDSFIEMTNKFLTLALENEVSSVEDLLKVKYDDSLTVGDKIVEQTGVIGEKLEIAQLFAVSAAYVYGYNHPGNRVASIIGLSQKIDDAEDTGKNLAIQVASMRPIALDETQVDTSVIEKEKEIAREQLIKEGKPEKVIDNILVGKVKKFMKDNTLIGQEFVMSEDKQTVGQFITKIDKDLKITAGNFIALGS